VVLVYRSQPCCPNGQLIERLPAGLQRQVKALREVCLRERLAPVGEAMERKLDEVGASTVLQVTIAPPDLGHKPKTIHLTLARPC
jgi:hypothetical protein